METLCQTEKETEKEKKGQRAETEKEAKEDTEHLTVNKKTEILKDKESNKVREKNLR